MTLYTETLMNIYFPFIHEPQKKEKLEPLPLYIEVGPPIEKKEEEREKQEECGVIVIELW
jgi:hypothetical protein